MANKTTETVKVVALASMLALVMFAPGAQAADPCKRVTGEGTGSLTFYFADGSTSSHDASGTGAGLPCDEDHDNAFGTYEPSSDALKQVFTERGLTTVLLLDDDTGLAWNIRETGDGLECDVVYSSGFKAEAESGWLNVEFDDDGVATSIDGGCGADDPDKLYNDDTNPLIYTVSVSLDADAALPSG